MARSHTQCLHTPPNCICIHMHTLLSLCALCTLYCVYIVRCRRACARPSWRTRSRSRGRATRTSAPSRALCQGSPCTAPPPHSVQRELAVCNRRAASARSQATHKRTHIRMSLDACSMVCCFMTDNTAYRVSSLFDAIRLDACAIEIGRGRGMIGVVGPPRGFLHLGAYHRRAPGVFS